MIIFDFDLKVTCSFYFIVFNYNGINNNKFFNMFFVNSGNNGNIFNIMYFFFLEMEIVNNFLFIFKFNLYLNLIIL